MVPKYTRANFAQNKKFSTQKQKAFWGLCDATSPYSTRYLYNAGTKKPIRINSQELEKLTFSGRRFKSPFFSVATRNTDFEGGGDGRGRGCGDYIFYEPNPAVLYCIRIQTVPGTGTAR